MTTIPPEALSLMQESGQMSYVAINSDESSTSQSSVLDGALKGVWEKLQHADKGRATRLAVHELGGLDWGNISMAVSLFSRNNYWNIPDVPVSGFRNYIDSFILFESS